MNIERQYEYSWKWKDILWVAISAGVSGAVFAYSGATNDRGLNINYLIPLSRGAAAVFYWLACSVSLSFVAFAGLMAIRKATQPQRIAFTSDSMLVPSSPWTSQEITIGFDSIRALAVVQLPFQRALYVYRNDGTKLKIGASLLLSEETFQDVCDLLSERMPPGGRTFRMRGDRRTND